MMGERDVPDVIAACLEFFDEGNETGIEEVCRRYPDIAPDIRSAIAAARGLDSGPVPPPPMVRKPEVGGSIGRFSVVRILGRGGAGVVYLVHDPKLDRHLALKLLSTIAPSGEEFKRFDRETGALARLLHPGIVSIHDVGSTDDGAPYFTMDYVEGSSLEAILQRLDGRDPRTLRAADLLPAEAGETPKGSYVHAAVQLIARTADALEQAHRAGVVHRDVKPGNILVDRGGEPHLVDFGIARGPGAQTVTRTGSAPGTPLYMAPEQVSGEGSQVGPWTDVFACGVTLYQLLTLRAPFSGESTLEVLARIQRDNPPSLPRINRNVPIDLQAVVAKALEKAPSRRYPSAAALRDDLEAFLAHRPTQARPAGSLTRIMRWSQRHPAHAVALGAGLLAVLVSLAVVAESLRELKRGDALLDEYEVLYRQRRAVLALLDRDEWRMGWYVDEAERGRIWKARRELAELEIGCELSIRNAQESYKAVLDLPLLGGMAKRRLADARDRWARDARRRGDLILASTLSEESQMGDGTRDSAVPVSIHAVPEEGETFLFRYEPYTSLPGRGERIPRLVPIPVNASGSTMAFPEGGFQPGDLCLVVVAAELGNPLELDKGDLILSVDGRPAVDGAYVTGVVPGGIADEAGVLPYDKVVRIDGQPVVRSFEWRMVRVPTPGHRYKAEIETRASGSITILGPREPIPESTVPNWIGSFLPTGDKKTFLSQAIGRHILGPEDFFEMTVGGIEEILTVPPPRDIVLEVLVDGQRATRRIPAGYPTGLQVERTAYPLVLSRKNRIVGGASVPPGSYLCLVRAPAYADLRLPFFVDGAPFPSGTSIDLVADPPHATDVPPGFVCIEAGPSPLQGDPNVPFAEQRKDQSLGRFLLSRHEVSVAEWWEFLDAEGIHEEIENYFLLRGIEWGGQEIGARGELPWLPPDLPIPCTPRGHPWEIPTSGGRWLLPSRADLDSPVVGLRESHVRRFVEWRNRRARASDEVWTYRLPTAEEWEKAARGADGRAFVWGPEFDFSLTNSFLAGERGRDGSGRVKLEPVGSFPTDESPYGIRDLAGSASEWNDSLLPGFSGWTILRGGSWATSTPVYFRAACRITAPGAYPQDGFRLVAVPRER